jgi:prepilin-type N-terminal cleavage/methylation domain-containing protein
LRPRQAEALTAKRRSRRAGFTLIEMVIVVAAGVILTAIAIPVITTAMVNMRINSAVSQFSGAIASARYQAIKDSQPYTLVLTAPANTYLVTNTSTGRLSINTPAPVPMSTYVSIDGGTAGTYTYTLCPNGIVYGAGGCPSANAPPALLFTYQSRQINVSVSGVGNVTTKNIQ